MSRKKNVLTPEQIAERKSRWWGAARNARRRARYHGDAIYRDKAIQQVRTSYCRSRVEAGLPVREDDCRENLPLLPSIGQLRTRLDGATAGVPEVTFTMSELAVALGRNTQVVYRWIADAMLPEPVLMALNHRNRRQAVYGEAEVRAMLSVFGEHEQTSQYYRQFHLVTRERLFAAARSARPSDPNPVGCVINENGSRA